MSDVFCEISADAVVQLGMELGFCAVGATGAEPFADLLPRLRKYYEEGRASGFEHPVAEERIDPQTVLPGARSLIAVALPYVDRALLGERRPAGRRGVVSLYARGEDYHRTLRRALENLAARIEQAVGRSISWRTSIDTTPLVDRAVAERAGIGFIGKNCCVITPGHGSWVFLGTLLTDVAIGGELGASVSGEPADGRRGPATAADECGDCDLCLQACPTGALREPFVLDSSRCLSFVTQMKGHIPEELREPLGRRVWGCDTCQRVCPKNRVSLAAIDDPQRLAPELGQPELRAILELSNRAFQRTYGHTAAAWRGAQVWRRNAVIALGNAGDRAAVPQLIELLRDARPEIRGSAAWALSRIDPAQAAPAVRAARLRETDAQARCDMAWAAVL